MLHSASPAGLAREMERDLSKALPNTAEAARVRFNAILDNLPPSERKRFWRAIYTHPDNESVQTLKTLAEEYEQSSRDFIMASLEALLFTIKTGRFLTAQLKKHRRPKQNAERDSEIMRLHREGKSSAGISKLIASNWSVKPSAVRRVIKRHTDKQSE